MRISERGQITIPKRLRERYGLWANVEVELVEDRDGLHLRKTTSGKHPVDRVSGILGRDFDVDAYIEQVRGR